MEEKFKGIENEYIHAVKYQLDDSEKDKFVALKKELTNTQDIEKANEIRTKMAKILGVKETIENTHESGKVNIDLNKKTGVCKIVGEGFEKEIKMDASDYTRKGLKKFKEDLLKNENISKEDREYVKNIDPTLYKAYLEYDNANQDKNNSMAKMYVNAVIAKSKAIETDKKIENVKMPGKVNIDIGWHPRMKNTREKEQKFKAFKDILSRFRANKILKKHGVPGVVFWKKLDIANVSDNRKLIGGIIAGTSTLAALGTAVNLQVSNPEQSQKSTNNQQIEEEMKAQNETDSNLDKDVNENSEKENNTTDSSSKKENSKIYPGDIITAEQYTAVYGSADAKEATSALNTKEMIGVNKIACVIDGVTYSSKNYSSDEIYKMAEKAGVKVRYHVDKAIEMDGKICVQVNEKNNPSPSYIYNDNGVTKKINGKEWKGDTEYSSIAGWMKQKDIQKSEIKERPKESVRTKSIKCTRTRKRKIKLVKFDLLCKLWYNII